MLKKIENFVSLGGRYAVASVVYLGLILFLLGTMPKIDFVQADEESGCTHTVMVEGVPTEFEGCEEGYICCGGSCIDESTCSCCDDSPSCGEPTN
ncbi:MAG: hypothetical protein LBJ67_15505 [Planctomycetaceae bacterium]|jgi:hypothetical protein|nr:hypothetical protein [Planctomycetaceae bacterium]